MRLLRSRASVWVFVALLITAFLWMIPEIYLLSVSLRTPDNAFDPHLFVTPFTVENYLIVIKQNPLFMYLLNSLIVTVPTVIIVLFVASLFSFGHAILRAPLGKHIYAMLLTTLMVPMAALVLPLASMLKHFGWINTYQGLIGPYSSLGIPFAIVVLNAFLEDAPKDIYEAALIDGCNWWQLYWRITLPLIRSPIVFLSIWQFITTWNEFFLALVVMTDSSHKTLPLVPMQYSGMYMANPGALFAILVIIAAPLIFLFVLVQRGFISGLLEGAVKG
ncbi:MAG: carbohydrate ABC transporter permease [Alicyclobacillus sp.]|nr:carbohydrate ABC transporter permease [Alicyclobacillus sp.]